MDSTSAPTKIQLPFANAGAKNTIPVTSQIGIVNGAASFFDGFPPLTRTPIVAGGVPPFGTDMNGILYAITAIQQWQSAGALFKYDAAFSAAIGGYPKGAQLINATADAIWLNTAENNTTNPDTGGAGWVLQPTALSQQKATAISAVAGGTSDAITGVFIPTIAALPSNPATLFVLVRAASANTTTTPTFKADGTAAKAIVKGANTPLLAGDIAGAGHWLALQYDAVLDKWVLQNPAHGETFTQSGAGSVARSIVSKLQERVSVRDKGAVGDGVTDDTAAFQAAANAANVVYVPYTMSSYLLNTAITAPGVRWVIDGKLTGPGGLPSMTNVPATQFFSDIQTPTGALALQPGIRSVITSKGDNTTFIGGVAGHFEARDRSDVTALNKGVLYGVEVFVNPIVARNNVPFDDCVGLSITNITGISGANATDAIYIAHNYTIFPSSSEWYSGLTIDAFIDVGIQITGRVGSIGFDFKSATMVTGIAMRFGNTHGMYWRNAGDTADLQALKYDANNILNIGDSSSAGIKFPTWWGGPIPSVQSGTSYTVGATDTDVIFTNASTVTVTLPNPTGFRSGRILTIKTTNGGAVNSASSNVAPLGAGAVASAILPATAGKWAILKADGVNWTIMAAN